MTKRLILGLGGKGGTGKTSFMALLYYWLTTTKVKVQGFDADVENPDFFRIHQSNGHNVSKLDLLDTFEARDFLMSLNKLGKKRPEVILIDMPGASGYQTREIIDKFRFFEAADSLGYRITLCSVINTEPAPIVSLESMIKPYESKCDYLVVKPEVWTKDGKDFSLWEESEARRTFIQLKGIEIEMPILEPIVFQSLREKKLSFFAIETLPFPDNLLASSFLELSRLQIDQASHYVGLSTRIHQKEKDQVLETNTTTGELDADSEFKVE